MHAMVSESESESDGRSALPTSGSGYHRTVRKRELPFTKKDVTNDVREYRQANPAERLLMDLDSAFLCLRETGILGNLGRTVLTIQTHSRLGRDRGMSVLKAISGIRFSPREICAHAFLPN